VTATYAGNRTVYDADSHIMETYEMVAPHADDELRAVLQGWANGPAGAPARAGQEEAKRRASDPAEWDSAVPELMTRKLWAGLGSFDAGERSRALDLLGFEAQLVFGTLNLFLCNSAPRVAPGPVQYRRARAFNAAMAEFCRHDPRLIGVANVPLFDPDLARAEAEQALSDGCGAIMITTTPHPDGLSVSHPDFDPFWDLLEDADVPFVLHVGINLGPTGGHDFVPAAFRRNGHDRQRISGGEGQLIDHLGYLTLGTGPSLCLGVMALEGVFMRHPRLRGACAEQGAVWVPSWLRQLDLAHTLSRRVHPDLPELEMKPSDYIRRHVKFTPFVGEPVGWIIDQVGPEMLLFSSDYPHTEGGTDPIRVFDATMDGVGEEARHKFYAGNLRELLKL